MINDEYLTVLEKLSDNRNGRASLSAYACYKDTLNFVVLISIYSKCQIPYEIVLIRTLDQTQFVKLYHAAHYIYCCALRI